MLQFDDHPMLHPAACLMRWPAPLGEIPASPDLRALAALDADVPVSRNEDVRGAVRRLLRHGGHKPSGRGKPSAEYLVRAAEGDGLPIINPAVDACNVVSLHSGLPISVVDADLATAPHRVGLPGDDAEYVFNASGQTIRLKGLLCLFDADGPCANSVKDSQRTKTHPGTRSTLSVVWGPNEHVPHVEATLAWYRACMEMFGAETVWATGM
tara:strand:+ start:2524 stop:3156 length:633 start_codon:yes stop_codon:yes gene_type:complete